MKKVFNLYNISLLLILVLISVLTLKTTEVKAAGTLTWPDGSTATISRTVQNVYNAPVVDFTYRVEESLAMFDTGKVVNAKMKTLANNLSKAWDDYDSKIKAIKKGSALPNGFTPATGNTISTSESAYPIYIWFDNTSSSGIIYYYSEANEVYLNPDSSYLCYQMELLSDISGYGTVNTSLVVNMEYIFAIDDRSQMDLAPLANWDTSNVTNMKAAFAVEDRDWGLLNISALSNWDVSKVANMMSMFFECSSITDLSFMSNWDTSSVTDMTSMFMYCGSITGTIQILGNPTSYSNAFRSAATVSGAPVTVNYSSATTNIDAIIATKSSGSNVVKGSVVSVPSGGNSPGSSSAPEATISFDGSETVSNNYTASKSTTINLANMGLNLTEPGNYDLTVSESATSNNAYPATNTEYTIVVTVRNELNANNRPTGNLEARFYIKDSNDNKVNTMSFSAPKDESKFGHIELTKKVGGLMGGINTYFDFSIQIDDAASNACSSYSGSEKYPVSGGDSSHVTISEVTKCKSGTKDSLSLKHNQTAVIGQFTYNNNTYDSISIDDYYKIVEASASNYTTTFKIGSGSSTSGRDTSSQSVSNGTNTVTYVNTREGSPLTGVVLTILPFLILIGIGAGGLILFRKKKGFKKDKKEELEVI
ncbi:MAG: BspA family leucine-rich repeat surface protein [Bacilli bacterium]|nr:BspA family leucine-rich repeat surface protein [Bacilli bacterium]